MGMYAANLVCEYVEAMLAHNLGKAKAGYPTDRAFLNNNLP